MKVLIKNYKGWNIFFETDIDMFYTVPTQYVTDQFHCSTFSCVKEFIDKYVKSNKEFKPIHVERYPPVGGVRVTGKLTGMAEDGHFMLEVADAEPTILSQHSELSWILINEHNNQKLDQIERLYAEIASAEDNIKTIQQSASEIKKTMVIENVTDIRRRVFLCK